MHLFQSCRVPQLGTSSLPETTRWITESCVVLLSLAVTHKSELVQSV